jgi:spermidine synthase
MLLVGGVEQSYVDTLSPKRLYHVYVRRVATLIDTLRKAGDPIRVLHLGGGALTLPRYIAATRPGSVQLVIERRPALDRVVRETMPLPEGADIRTVFGDARTTLEQLTSTFDLVITDVYDGARMPPSVSSVEFVELAKRVLAPGGCYVVNVTDLPPALYSRIQAATLRAVFRHVCAIAEPGMLRGRLYGNIVLAGTSSLPAARVARLERINARDEVPAKVLTGEQLDTFIGGVGPMRD